MKELVASTEKIIARPKLIEKRIGEHHLGFGPIYHVSIETTSGIIDLSKLVENQGLGVLFVHTNAIDRMWYDHEHNVVYFNPGEAGRDGFFLDFFHELGHPLSCKVYGLSGSERKEMWGLIYGGMTSPHIRAKKRAELTISDLNEFGPWLLKAVNYLVFSERAAWALALDWYRKLKNRGKNIAPEFASFQEIQVFVHEGIKKDLPFVELSILLEKNPKIGRIPPSEFKA